MYKLLLIAKRHLVISYTRYANSVLASLDPRRFTRNEKDFSKKISNLHKVGTTVIRFVPNP